ncbi:MAG: relaxase domain-containing protein, partial [Actinomycetota bacterium]|nr:relaxase domain-containing protein [Actinomycetota bacterium]
MRKALEYYLAYADESASPGFWVGAGAEASFGFATGSPVAREDFVAVMTVRDPAAGELLSPRTKNLIRRDRRPGFDVVFRMERSAALAFVACPEARSAIRAAHEEGIRQAVSYFEQELLVAKSVRDALGRPMATSGLAAAGFHHYANRSGDPDLHTHLIVANLVRRADGTWATFAAGKLMGAASTLSAIYHMVFFAEVERVFGAQIRRDPITGYRRLRAVSNGAIEEFLSRTHEVDAYIEEMGWPDTEVARQQAVLATRRSKAQAELLADERSWKERMAAVGVTRQAMREALNLDATNPAPAVMSPAELAEAEARIVARLASTNRTHLYREQVVREWARELEGVSEIGPLLALVDHTMDERRALICRYAADRDGTALYATPSLDELRRLLGDHAVAEAHAADSATPHGAAVDPGVRPTAEAPISAP